MNEPSPEKRSASTQNFADEAGRKPKGTVGELIQFLLENKSWWLAPIVIMLLLVGVLVVLGSSVAAPFIYPLF